MWSGTEPHSWVFLTDVTSFSKLRALVHLKQTPPLPKTAPPLSPAPGVSDDSASGRVWELLLTKSASAHHCLQSSANRRQGRINRYVNEFLPLTESVSSH